LENNSQLESLTPGRKKGKPNTRKRENQEKSSCRDGIPIGGRGGGHQDELWEEEHGRAERCMT